MKRFPMVALMVATGLTGAAATAHAATDTAALFKKKCAMCHAVDKKKVGPALKDMNKDPAVLKTTITNGRKMMPKYGGKLSAEEIDAMVAFIRSKQ